MHTIGRFAPSPSGRMHLGNVLCALLAWLSARQQNGEFLLRIEDLDESAVRAAFADLIIDDLRWLGLDWDGEIPYQSERTAVYEQYEAILREKVCCTRVSARERPCTPQARRTCRTAGWSTPAPAAI